MKKIRADLMPLYALPEEDARKFIAWVWALRDKNAFDMKVLSYPRACMTRAQDEDGTLMMVPLQPVLMYESLAPKPGLTDREMALCLKRISEIVEQAMRDTGHAETYFLTTEDKMAGIAATHGWEEVKGFRVMRRKVDLPKYGKK